MAKNETTKQRGWLNKSDMASSLGISPQAFDKWGVEPVSRIGREAFYRVQDVVQNRVEHAGRKQQLDADGGQVLDPLIEYKLAQEKLRLTSAQADAQEQKNQVAARTLVPAPFATFALAKIAAKIGSKLETVCKTVRSRIPDVPPLVLEAFEREIALARNMAVEFADDIPEILDEYAATLDD
ncbi:terminase small subunit [Pseudomonas sp. GV071]|uniref:terminase small subunit n=1 Tax=Pseudomonas sp. GV071 TaxID=2135754 RepID=UPI000D343E61|nr:terminase small subunit [Pseudomonas sp. GV071]PTQ70363.1 phage terminase Nu1 subunit (DNA packaging protein) [Pseudomonas sp. GV071]